MLKTVEIEVAANTWPKPPGLPAFPAGFHKGTTTVSVHVPQLLHVIGILTTPTEPIGPTLSLYWAYVRYISAITAGADLRITGAFAALDSHQKTILSDDFGMGVPMWWLWGKVNAFGFCDGQYFIKSLAAAFGVAAPKKAKRGPNKSPDFVLLDTSGKWHVVECKGTQSGHAYRDRQLGKATPKPSGGVEQKESIIFPASVLGQRLACGLSIGVENGPFQTHLRIVDPTRAKKFTVHDDWIGIAKEVVVRATLARALRLSGFEATAAYIAANGPVPAKANIRQRVRLERIEYLRERASSELATRETGSRTTFGTAGQAFVGRGATFNLSQAAGEPEPAGMANIQQGTSKELVDALMTLEVQPGRRDRLAPQLIELMSGITVSGEGDEPVMSIGTGFRSVLRLKTVNSSQV